MNKIIGYDTEFKSLFNHLKNNNLNNSLLITGTKGIGKYFFLIKLIKDYISIKINNDKIIHHSNLINNNSHPNIKIVQKEIDDKTKKLKSFITIDQIRKLNYFSRETAIIEDIPKFIIIDSADDLNLNASNALLKILEEPKKNTFFFLISHKPSLILPTIKSRCLKINLPNHNFDNFNNILRIRNIKLDDENTRFLFDITNGSPGLSNEYDYEEILEIFNKLITSLTDYDPFTDLDNNLIEILSNFENEKLKIYLSLIKFILIVLNKIKIGLDLNDYYLSSNILKIKNLSDITSTVCINNKLDYLINNENDLFTFNLDKKIFMINFFAVR